MDEGSSVQTPFLENQSERGSRNGMKWRFPELGVTWFIREHPMKMDDLVFEDEEMRVS